MGEIMTNRLVYRTELIACNLAIEILRHSNFARPVVQWLNDLLCGKRQAVAKAALTASGFTGLLAGYLVYFLVRAVR